MGVQKNVSKLRIKFHHVGSLSFRPYFKVQVKRWWGWQTIAGRLPKDTATKIVEHIEEYV